MKMLIAPALWAAAVLVALLVLFRMRRGKHVVLTGRFSPAFIRMVAVVLVLVTGSPALAQESGDEGGEKPPAAGEEDEEEVRRVPLEGDLPSLLSGRREWVYLAQEESAWSRLKALVTILEAHPEAAERAQTWTSAHGLAEQLAESIPEGARRHAGRVAPPEGGEHVPLTRFSESWQAELARLERGEATSLADLDRLLTRAENAPLYDAWLAGYLWRRSAGLGRVEPLTDAENAWRLAHFYGRLERHVRVARTIDATQAVTGRPEFRAWRSKAGPPPGWRDGLQIPRDFFATAEKTFDRTDAGDWDDEATIAIRVLDAPSGIVLRRRGERVELAEGDVVHLRRLDVLSAKPTDNWTDPLVLGVGEPLGGEGDGDEGDGEGYEPTLGRLSLTPGRSLSTHGVAEAVADDGVARERIEAWIAGAREGDAAALASLEAHLPAVIEALRETGEERFAGLVALFDR